MTKLLIDPSASKETREIRSSKVSGKANNVETFECHYDRVASASPEKQEVVRQNPT